MSIKLIASDIDGTLVTDDKRLLPETAKAILRFEQTGGIFVIASGRPLKGIMKYADELEMSKYGGYIISFNGSFILDLGHLKPLVKRFIDVDTAREVVRTADRYNMSITTYSEGTAITQRATDRYFMLETSINELEIKYTESLVDYITFPVPKFLITGEPKDLEEYEKILNNELNNVTVFRSEPFFLEIVPKSVNKGTSLDIIRKHLDLKKDSVIAFGDGFNDVSLLESAGLGIAMKNAQAPVIKAADYVTRSNNENGVGEAIERFALKL